jgi:RNA polymerase sigma-70 factor, ECF subfamily
VRTRGTSAGLPEYNRCLEEDIALITEPSDENLMSLFQQGDEPAYALLVQRYKDELTNFAQRFLGDRDDAEDVVQETFVRVWRKRASYAPPARFSTWLYTIASNLAKTRLRRLSLRRFIRLGSSHQDGPVFDLPDDGAGPDGAADETIREERIQEALKSLPVRFREAIVLRDIQQLSYEEIAAITGGAMGTVKSRINRARAMLRDQLRDLIRD